jgi:hypothetical protein
MVLADKIISAVIIVLFLSLILDYANAIYTTKSLCPFVSVSVCCHIYARPKYQANLDPIWHKGASGQVMIN